MKPDITIPIVSAAWLCAAPLACGQSTISTADHYAYAANAGWLDLLPEESHGVQVTESWLSGYAWAANFGWVHLGDGSPDNGHTYSNSSATDYGVNLNDRGRLTGFAWSPNIGWITFEQSHGEPRLDFLTGKITGCAWSANAGWICLNTNTSHLATARMLCPDSDIDGMGDAFEMRYFNSLTAANGSTDSDHDGSSDAAEYTAGTNPINSNSLLRYISHSWSFDALPSPSFSVSFTSVPNRLYQIEHDDDVSGFWHPAPPGTFPPDSGSSTSRTITFTDGGRQFFRVVAVRPLAP